MLVETRLVITIENGCLVVFGTGFYLFLGEIDVDSGIGLDHIVYPFRRDQYFLARPPIARLDQQITNHPVLIMDDEVLQMAEIAIGGFYVGADYVFGAT